LKEIKINEAKNPENNGNYKIVIKARQYKSEAYKANIRRRIRCYDFYSNSHVDVYYLT
jgi:hypothetical protein